MNTPNHAPADHTPEYAATFTLDRHLAQWRAETPAARRAVLDAEFERAAREAMEAEVERIRVKHGRGSAQFRRAAIRLAVSSRAMGEQ